MNNLYYITRSYTHTSFSGGAIMREGAVNLLRQRGFNVIVVTVSDSLETEVFSDDFIAIYAGKIPEKIRQHLQRFSLLPDYLAGWASKVVQYLINNVNSNDILFCSTGGDLASLMVGSAVKDEVGAKFVANFRDPVSYTNYYNNRLGRYTHIPRNTYFKKILSNVDLIVTSSNSYKAYLDTWISTEKITNHFGYLDSTVAPCDFSLRKESKSLKTFFGGTLAKYQAPKLVYGFFKNNLNLSLDVYGHSGSKQTEATNINFYKSLPRNEFLKKAVHSYDLGFVSLSDNYFGACIPSKIYEYINIGMPIIGFLPRGEARDIVNDNGYGYIALPDSPNDLKKKVSDFFTDQSALFEINQNILRDRTGWSMSSKIIELSDKLKTI
jgi:glycosyltransferase involved in cell wall biosynthesis